MPSVALTQLKDRLGDLDQLNRAHGMFTKGRKGRQWFTMPLNRAAIVLLCAHFEGFLEDIFEEYVQALCHSAANVDIIPPKLRVTQVESKLDEASEAGSRQERSERLREVFELASPLWEPGRAIQPGDLDATHVTEKFSNPGFDEILWLFDFLELKKKVGAISWRAASKKSVRKNIDKMVKARNKIAHGVIDVGVRKADVTRYRKYVVGFAKAIDRILLNTFKKEVGVRPW